LPTCRFAGTFPLDALSGVADGLLNFEVPDTADCRACYNCKVRLAFDTARVVAHPTNPLTAWQFPEMRVVFWLVATTTSIVSPDYFRVSLGNTPRVSPKTSTLPSQTTSSL